MTNIDGENEQCWGTWWVKFSQGERAMNVYLTYYKTLVVGGKNYYYLRAVQISPDLALSLLSFLIQLSGSSLEQFFTMSAAAPEFVAGGTNCYDIEGGTWSAPTDLYLVATTDYPVVLGDLSGGWSSADLMLNSPFLIYAEVKAHTLDVVDLPSELQTNASSARAGGILTIPSTSLTQAQVTAASRYNNYPFWTTTNFHYWYVYEGCEYDPEATPDYNLHVTLTMGYNWYPQFIASGPFEGQIYWKHDGHHFRIDSCNDELYGIEIWTVDDTVSYTDTYVYLADQPSQYFSPDFVFGGLPLQGGSNEAANMLLSLIGVNLHPVLGWKRWW